MRQINRLFGDSQQEPHTLLSGESEASFKMDTQITEDIWAKEVRVQGLQMRSTVPLNWLAVYTSSHHEKRVAEHLEQRDIESFLPTYPASRLWRNRCKTTVAMPLFPSYVFVRIDPRQRVRVLAVPGVLSLVGSAGKPTPLPDCEIESLRAGLGQRTITPYPYLVAGERVRIKAGVMAGIEGVLVRQKSNFRVVLTLETITQSVAVEVDVDELEPAPTRTHSATA